MEKGDYIRHNDTIVKITGHQTCYNVEYVDGSTEHCICVSTPNIILNEDILALCGFKKCIEESKFILTLGRNEKIKCRFTIPGYICEIYTTSSLKPIEKHVDVLSELQNFVRTNLNKELPIDFKGLAETAK